MFFDIGWPELMLIGVVALVVIGPKDLPAALRVAGFWVRKARILSREFQSSVEQMIREAELDEMHKELKKATEFDLNREIEKAVDPTGELTASLKPPDVPDYFEPASAAAALPPPEPAVPAPAEPVPAEEAAAEPLVEPTIMPPAAEIAAHDAEAAAEALPPPRAAPAEPEATREPAPSKS
jgi:sec-independent protein translocase protein TatB